MPEICEVVLTGQALFDKLQNKKLSSVTILNGRYAKKPFNGHGQLEEDIHKKLTLKSIDTKGKFLWFTFSDSENNDSYLLNTFGLAGKWGLNTKAKNEANIQMTFGNTSVYFLDQRNFGTLEYSTNALSIANKLNKLTPDLLKENYTPKMFSKWFSSFEKTKKNGDKKIVKVLMEQNKGSAIGCGLGNYLVPEILYQTKISPHRLIKNVTDKERELLGENIKKILKQCYVYNKTGYVEYLGDFIEHHYDGIKSEKYPNYHPKIPFIDNNPLVFNVYRKKQDLEGNEVIAEKIISGRTAYWCPTVQT
jgi:formamidopyrimidine-DNA glycosylase